MAHGPSHGGVSVHPDLTPMLDVVMQLLMYFIMCVNFVAEETRSEIQLPMSQGAIPIDKSEGDILHMNVNAEGQVLVLSQPPMSLADAEFWLDNRAKDAPRDKDNKIKTAIIIRADGATDYATVYQVMQICRKKGFLRFKVRAKMVGARGP
jgi:biopolymer transport protein ExbD